MMASEPVPAIHRFAPPAALLLVMVPAVLWALPQGLPPWRTASIVTAWAGSALLAATLLLMVREPRWARLMGGLECMYRWHHRGGVLAYCLLLIHPLALAAERWNDSPQLAWQALAPWEQSWPVWLGWIALAMLMLGLGSTFALHLPYRRWRGLHMTLGTGVLVGLLHGQVILAQGSPLLALLAFTALVLGWRLLIGDRGLAAFPYRVTHVERRAAGLVELTLAPRARALAALPGQFVLAAFHEGPGYRGCGEFHPFTLSYVDASGTLRLGIKALGACTKHTQQTTVGTEARLQGPFGTFLSRQPQAPQLWVAGGIGIAPFVAALRAGPCTYPTTLFYFFRTQADAAFLDELQQRAASDPLLELVASASGEHNPDVAHLLERVRELDRRQVFICGPPAMVELFGAELRTRSVRRECIHTESFDFRR
jgi:predicted ferric reductase